MEPFFASGRVAEVVLAFMLLEALVLAVAGARLGWTGALRDLGWNLAAGAALVLALRAALVGSAWPWIAALLGVALVAHALDVLARARLAAKPGQPTRTPRRSSSVAVPATAHSTTTVADCITRSKPSSDCETVK